MDGGRHSWQWPQCANSDQAFPQSIDQSIEQFSLSFLIVKTPECQLHPSLQSLGLLSNEGNAKSYPVCCHGQALNSLSHRRSMGLPSLYFMSGGFNAKPDSVYAQMAGMLVPYLVPCPWQACPQL